MAAGLTGRWVGSLETKAQPVPVVLTLIQDRQLSGVIATGNDRKHLLIKHLQLNGDQLTFEVHDNANRIMKFRLEFKDMRLSGEVDVGGEVALVTLSRPLFAGDKSVTAPVLVHKVNPVYTKEARKAKVEGTVFLYAEISREGVATNIEVIRGLDSGLDEKAVDAVKRWKFKPGEKNGESVTVAATFQVNFRLQP